MKKHNVLMILVDALRFDQFADENRRGVIAPNLDQLVRNGLMVPLVTNSHTTKFAMPSLFSQSFPLDYGGYNFGIRYRKESYIETIKKKKKNLTLLIASCNQMSVGQSYERGFDQVLTTHDFRILLEQKITRIFSYEVNLYKNKNVT